MGKCVCGGMFKLVAERGGWRNYVCLRCSIVTSQPGFLSTSPGGSATSGTGAA